MTAVIPAAGRGTRMASVTASGGSKEMLPLGGQPVISRVISEARSAGADRIIVVSHPAKSDLNRWLAETKAADVAWQHEQHGLAHAVASAGTTDWHPGSDDVLVLLADTVFRGAPLGEEAAVRTGLAAAVLVEEVPPADVSKYGIVDAPDGSVRSIVEKPRPEDAPSRLAIAGRYWLSATAMARLGVWVKSQRGTAGTVEIGMTAFLNELSLGAKIAAVRLEPVLKRYDCGDPESYAQAAFEFEREA